MTSGNVDENESASAVAAGRGVRTFSMRPFITYVFVMMGDVRKW